MVHVSSCNNHLYSPIMVNRRGRAYFMTVNLNIVAKNSYETDRLQNSLNLFVKVNS